VRSRLLALSVLMALAAPGCSGGNDSSPSTTIEVTTTTADWADGLTMDDTGTFAFDAARYQLPSDTSPVVTPLGEFPAISLSSDLVAYQSSPIANGITIAMVAAVDGSARDVIEGWFPDDQVCPGTPTMVSVDTLFGTADGLADEGCGPNGDIVRAVFAVDIVSRDAVVVVALRGDFTAADAMLLAPEFMRVRFP